MNSNDILHDSALKHVTGQAVYVNDMKFDRQLHGRVVYSRIAHAKILSLDTSDAAKIPGVVNILIYKDIPGRNQMGPVVDDEYCIAEDEITFAGQAIALIAAETPEAAFEAEKLIQLETEPLEAIVTLEKAIELNSLIAPVRTIASGHSAEALKTAPFRLSGTLSSGAQEHWYLETQTAVAVPGEGNEMKVFASSQNPSETQAIVAEVLGITKNEVEVEVRRIGGGFGGKETQGNHVAAWAALLASAAKRPVGIQLFRDDDQLMTGKRHRFLSKYEIGFTQDGKILAYEAELNMDAGAATDLSRAILERAMLHAENAYFIPNVTIIGKAYKTNLPSNTAFRGFGGPQGMAVIENAIDRIARFLKKDAADIRKTNFYGNPPENLTPYGETIENNRLHLMFDRLTESSEYRKRRNHVEEFNLRNELYKKGIALTPVKFGISFTTAFLNQAAALVHIYNDGTIAVNHGGTEMGQGLYTKILGIAAIELGVSPEFIKIVSTNTSKVPNTSATAASSGSDLNGMAVRDAIRKLKERMMEIIIPELENTGCGKVKSEEVLFENNLIFAQQHPEIKISLQQVVKKAYLQQVSLSATGFYKTPGIHFFIMLTEWRFRKYWLTF